MFSFFKKNKDQGVPSWASFFTIKEYNAFIKAVEKYFQKQGVPYTLENGALEFDEDNPFGFQLMGLTNLAQGCKQNSISEYSAIVAHHFDSMFQNVRLESELEQLVKDFAKVKEYLGIRCYDNHYVSSIGKENAIGFDMGQDLYAMLVFDLPDSIRNVQPEHIETWGKTKEELFQLGIQNIKSNYDFPIMKEQIDGVDIYAVVTDHFFSPNIYFDLENRPELVGVYGSIICFPHRHTTLIYPIDNLNVTRVLHHLMTMAYGMNVEGPGSITNKVYWLNNKKLQNIEYSLEEQRISITPSEEFLAMLNTLGGNEESKVLN